MSDILPPTLKELADFFHTIPGIGKKTALRYTIQLLNQEPKFLNDFGLKLQEINHKIVKCERCFAISETPVCGICKSNSRNNELICVVEDIRDVIAIENTRQYNGKYHVLGGVISPIDGIGPNDLNIDSLIKRIENNEEVKEIVLALSTTMEGDTTNYFLYKKLNGHNINISTIARGVGFGDQIEYADELTLGKSISNRTPYKLT